jgi:hypothetical protein
MDKRYSLTTPDSTLIAAEDLLNRLCPAEEGRAATITTDQAKAASLLMGAAIKIHSLQKSMRPKDALADEAPSPKDAPAQGPFQVYNGGR